MRGQTGIEIAAMPAQAKDVSRCHCGGWLWFSTDSIGRTVENCEGCGYEGPQRTQSTKEPKPPQRRRDGPERACARIGCGNSIKPRGQLYCSRACAGIASAPERGNQMRGVPKKRKNYFPQLMVGKNDPLRDDAA